jgi:GDP-4-dehydro-6-deoxy-D-mannose reductase
MRALITGANGFVGRWLRAHLGENGDEVTGVDLPVDVTDAEALRREFRNARPEAIYHLAARTHVGDSWHEPLEVYRVNVLGTAAVLSAAREAEIDPAIVVVSSAEVYGIVTPNELPLTESAPVRPATPYAASKLAAEAVALQAFRGFNQRVMVVRPFNHVGPGQAPIFAVPALASRLVEAARSGATSISVGTLTTARDFTDVRDVVAAYRLLVERGEPGGVYNVSSGRSVAIATIAKMLVEIVGADVTLTIDPSLVRPVDIPVLRGDASALEAATGWAPTISLRQTLADVVAEFERRS